MKKILIVGGLGRIGLTAAAVLSEFYDVVLHDTNDIAIERFRNKLEATFMEPGLNEILKERKNITLAKHGLMDAIDCDYVIITIGTPVDEYLQPCVKDLFFIRDELAKILTYQTVILRSTVAVGTTKKFESKFKMTVSVAFCPERVAGGKMIEEMQTLPQIISANNRIAMTSAFLLFHPLEVEIYCLANTDAGEMTKLMTNSYRYIEFAITNQFFCMATEAGCDFYEMLHAMKDNYPRMANFPLPGFAGSYCLRKDTLQLAAMQTGKTFSLGYDATLVNENLPMFVLQQMKEKYDLERMTVGILGMAFKGNTDDIRDSLSFRMRKILVPECKQVICHDPHVRVFGSLTSLKRMMAACDLFVLMTLHDEYKTIETKKPVIDIWNFLRKGTGL
jgi:UDP-N-acetyl-D-mannosaminuronic acid dehydrogenase